MTEAKYWQMVAAYATTEGCNSVLLKQLQAGFNKWNVLFLQQIAPQKAAKTIAPAETETESENTEGGYRDDETSRDLLVQMRHLIGAKRSLSNSLFDHQNNKAKCKDISEKILAYERDIETLRYQLGYYNDKGELPPEPTAEKGGYVFPSTKYGLDKALRGVRSMISQVQNECELLVQQGETAKLKKREQRIIELKIRKTELETRLKEHDE